MGKKKDKKEQQPHVTTVAVNENPKQPRIEKSSNPPWTFLCSGVASICHSDGIQTTHEAGTGTVAIAGAGPGVEGSPVASQQKEIALR